MAQDPGNAFMDSTQPPASPLVFVVDDDPGMRAALCRLFRSAQFTVEPYASGQELLDGCDLSRKAVLLLDVLMPGMTGLELQQKLVERGITTPIVFLTGTHSVPMAVTAMQRGAVDFLEKPFENEMLLERVRSAYAKQPPAAPGAEGGEFDARIKTLTPREREVMFLVTAGKTSKEIARVLEISPRTVEIHRMHLMAKMQAQSLAELVRMAIALGDRAEGPAQAG
jgi:FixJ family two-component response regulator